MSSNYGGWRTAAVLCLALLTTGMALAGPEDGPFFRHKDCPRSEYSPLHYWAPTLYVVRGYVHPSYLDQYPPGPAPAVPPSYDVQKSRCRTLPAAPSSPYADPASYYGRPLTTP